jgi:hypothetical protein
VEAGKTSRSMHISRVTHTHTHTYTHTFMKDHQWYRDAHTRLVHMYERVEPRLQSPLRLYGVHRDTWFCLETNCNRSNFTTTSKFTTPLIRICAEKHHLFFYELRKWIQPPVCRHYLHLSLSESVSYITRGDARDGVYWISKSVRICTVIAVRRLPFAEKRPQKG